MRQAHEPTSLAELSATNPARERLAYDEFFAHQLTLSLARAQQRRAKGRVTKGRELRQKVLAALPYDPTAHKPAPWPILRRIWAIPIA